MKKLRSLYVAAIGTLFIATGCTVHSTGQHKKEGSNLTTAVTMATTLPLSNPITTGDFNGDGKKEQAWVILPAFNKDSSDCIGECKCIIRFSDSVLPSIKIKGAINAELSNTTDLDKNGTDELGLLPVSFTGCWNDYHVYSFAGNQWVEVVEPFPVHYSQLDDGLPLIHADPAQKGSVLIHYSVNTEEGIVTKTKKARIR